MIAASPPDGQLRVAGEADDVGLLRLDETAPLASAPSVYRPRTFFGRAGLYERAQTIVAMADAAIVGAVCGAVKRVTLNGAPATVGHVFNLRVSPRCRRTGLGRKLVGAIEAWLASEGARTTFSLVGEQNAASLALFAAAGYRVVARAAYLCAWRAYVVVDDDGSGDRGIDLVDVGRSAPWNERILRTYAGRDFCPVDLIGELYGPRREGGYVGTLYAPDAQGPGSWLSVWDKDRAVRREPVRAADRGVFLYDVSLGDAPAFVELLRALFARFTWVERVVCFVPGDLVSPFALDAVATVDRHELVMLRSPAMPVRDPYLDVRD